MGKKLYRDTQAGALSGVCAGLAEYLQTEKAWIRLIFVLSVLFSPLIGLGLLGPVVYIVLWIVVPAKPLLAHAGEGQYRGAQSPGAQSPGARSPYDVDYRVYPHAVTPEGTGEFHRGMGKSGRTSDRTLVGLVLLLVGGLFLLHQLDILYWYDATRYWPLLLIVAGLAIVLGALRENSGGRYRDTLRDTGPEAGADDPQADEFPSSSEPAGDSTHHEQG